MPSLDQARRSNAELGSSRQEYVAVFVGGTSGIGEATAKQLVKAVKKPTVFLVGRSEASGSKILEELRKSNPNGSYSFIQSDLTLLRNVDKACNEISDSKKPIDLLFMSTGQLAIFRKDTIEGLESNHVLRYYARMRFIYNLLPSLSASGNARVVSVLGAGQEGKIQEDNFNLSKSFSPLGAATYASTMNSLAMEYLATQNPTISFIHVFPGIVRTPLMYNTFGGFIGKIVDTLSRPIAISSQESGERNLFISTSAAYPPLKPRDGESSLGVPLVNGAQAMAASTGKIGGGSYILNYDGANVTKPKLMQDYREIGFPAKVWAHTLDTFSKVLSPSS